VEHPKTRFIVFTGSKPVGWRFTSAREGAAGTNLDKRTILEMGGKDSIVVCADAEVDTAVEGVVASAFGFSGQKCSLVRAPLWRRPFTTRSLRNCASVLKN